ncbi:MAG: hypothetical protein ACXWUH_06380 [Burkholderiales bacterium]
MKHALTRKWARHHSDLPLNWWFAPLVACVGAFALLLGSLYAADIKASAPFEWGNGPLMWSAIAFWISLLVFGCLFGLALYAHSEATRTGLGELKERSAELQTLIRTLPPKGFLVTFEDLFRVSFDVDSRVGETEDGLRASIVVALGGIASLVRTFAGRDDEAQYFINLMVFRPTAQLRPEDLAKHVIFVEPGYNPNTWDGVLQLRQEFAYRFDQNSIEPDTQVEPIMLPIPEPSYRVDNGKPAILPGAPTVFCDPGKSAGAENTLELAAWCRERSALRSSVADELERYYAAGAGSAIRSFICMPIVVTPSGGTPVTIGVLNIQSSQPGFLPGEKAGQFVPLATPFILLIGRSLAKYRVAPKGVAAAVPKAAAAA